MIDPDVWLKEEDTEALKLKLHRAFWENDFPFIIPNAYISLGAYLVDFLVQGPDCIKTLLHQVMPDLILRWRPIDGFCILDDLLVVISRLPCPDAIPNIRWVFNTMLDKNNHQHDRYLCRCLKALVALGPMEDDVNSFRDLANKPALAPTCWRAVAHIPGNKNKREAGKFLHFLYGLYRETEVEQYLNEVCEIELWHMNTEDLKIVLAGYDESVRNFDSLTSVSWLIQRLDVIERWTRDQLKIETIAQYRISSCYVLCLSTVATIDKPEGCRIAARFDFINNTSLLIGENGFPPKQLKP